MRDRGWGYWVVVLGGLILALGTFTSQETVFDIQILSGVPPNFPLGAYQKWAVLSGVGILLSAAGFLLVFVGAAVAFRGPRSVLEGMTRRTFVILVSGGLLVAAGLASLSVLAFYAYQPFPPGLTVYLGIDLGGRIVEAVGFFVAFFGIAAAFRART
jgi:hypothetical protein